MRMTGRTFMKVADCFNFIENEQMESEGEYYYCYEDTLADIDAQGEVAEQILREYRERTNDYGLLTPEKLSQILNKYKACQELSK